MRKLREYPGFATVSSDLFNHTPNLEIEILRDQAKTYGVSETRILNLLRNAYSQNYLYLIKKPDDQYQVILEVAGLRPRQARGSVAAVHQVATTDSTGSVQRAGQLENHARPAGRQSPEPVHQRHDFFNLKPGVAIGDATDFIERRPPRSCRRRCAASLQARR